MFLDFLRLAPLQRRLLLIIADALLLPLSVWLSFWLRLAHPFPPSLHTAGWWLMSSVCLIGLPIYALTGQYKGLTRYVGSVSLYQLALRNGLLVMVVLGLGLLLDLPMPPRSSWLLLWVLLTGFTGSLRFGLRDVLLSLQSQHLPALTRVAIYGAGNAGVQLAASLRLSGNHNLVLFVDDDPTLWRRSVNGVQIVPFKILKQRSRDVDQVLLAIPSLSRSRRRQIVDVLQEMGLPVLQIPSMEEITTGSSSIDSLRPIQVEDLLGRDPVPPDPQLLGPGIAGSSVCVTGAGGSIGSELCRQILALKPIRLVLLERSEPSLYSIYQEFGESLLEDVELVPVLGSATDKALVERCFSQYQIDVVFHAAAYKHVPLVEMNPVAGLANNVLATRVVCNSARRCGLRQFVLISTDKAVRPTNVMGASKRLAEYVVQGQAPGYTRFTMVRFGNVLGSSGSVVPLFRRQITDGGPITLTHPDITRYFMTISEAVQLVLQAAVLSLGGDILLLDMGDPVRIKTLAAQMISLSGFSIRDENNPDGDIEIINTGLRPGEKLFEELLVDAKSESTHHPLIFRAHENTIIPDSFWQDLDCLEDAVIQHNDYLVLKLLAKLVPDWQPGKLQLKYLQAKL